MQARAEGLDEAPILASIERVEDELTRSGVRRKPTRASLRPDRRGATGVLFARPVVVTVGEVSPRLRPGVRRRGHR